MYEILDIYKDMRANLAYGPIDGIITEILPISAELTIDSRMTTPEGTIMLNELNRNLGRLPVIKTLDECGVRRVRDHFMRLDSILEEFVKEYIRLKNYEADTAAALKQADKDIKQADKDHQKEINKLNEDHRSEIYNVEDKYKAKIADLTAEYNTNLLNLQDRIDEASVEEVERLRNLNESNQNKIREASETIREQKNKIDEQDSTITEQGNQIAELTNDLNEANKQKEKYYYDLNYAKANIEDLTGKLRNAEGLLTENRNRVTWWKQTAERLNQRKDDLKAKHKEELRVMSELYNEEVKAMLQEINEKVDRLTFRTDNLYDTIESSANAFGIIVKKNQMRKDIDIKALTEDYIAADYKLTKDLIAKYGSAKILKDRLTRAGVYKTRKQKNKAKAAAATPKKTAKKA